MTETILIFALFLLAITSLVELNSTLNRRLQTTWRNTNISISEQSPPGKKPRTLDTDQGGDLVKAPQ